MTTKLVDSEGRLLLGSQFAGRTVVVDDSDPSRIVIRPTPVDPDREAWLSKNPTALGQVSKGLEQARSRQFSATPPNLEGDSELADEIAG